MNRDREVRVRRVVWLVVAAAGVAFGCARTGGDPGAESRAGGAAADSLVSSLAVRVGADGVTLVLNLTNGSAETVALGFPSAQRYDFSVLDDEGGTAWTWSADKLFAQVVGEERLAPGQTVRYEETWLPGGARGRFTAVARLTSTSHPVEERSAFELE
jgi:hypothetical protein